MTGDELSAREAQVLGAGPRLAPLSVAEMSGDALELIRVIARGLGYEGEWADEAVAPWFRIMARHPALYRLQMETGIHYFTAGAIPPAQRELAILRCAWLARAPYEWSEHVRIAHQIGMERDVIERITLGSAAPGWSRHEAAILAAVEELFRDDMIGDQSWAELSRSWNDRQLIELPAMIGQYRAVAGMQNSLRLPLNDDSEGLRAR